MSVEYKYIRQARLPEVGEAGQRALLAAHARPRSTDPLARDVEARYLRGAGVSVDEGAFAAGAPPGDRAIGPGQLASLSPGAREVAEGAWAALAQIKDILRQNR